MRSSIANLVYELPHELQNDLRLSIWWNKETFGKSEIWVETWSSAQPPFHKLNFGNSRQKPPKSRYQTFVVLSSSTGFLYFDPNILHRIVGDVHIMMFYRCPDNVNLTHSTELITITLLKYSFSAPPANKLSIRERRPKNILIAS